MEQTRLLKIKANEYATVKEIGECGNTRKRLYELGLNSGSKIQVVKNDVGPIILMVSGSKLALGRSIAEKIIVQI